MDQGDRPALGCAARLARNADHTLHLTKGNLPREELTDHAEDLATHGQGGHRSLIKRRKHAEALVVFLRTGCDPNLPYHFVAEGMPLNGLNLELLLSAIVSHQKPDWPATGVANRFGEFRPGAQWLVVQGQQFIARAQAGFFWRHPQPNFIHDRWYSGVADEGVNVARLRQRYSDREIVSAPLHNQSQGGSLGHADLTDGLFPGGILQPINLDDAVTRLYPRRGGRRILG